MQQSLTTATTLQNTQLHSAVTDNYHGELLHDLELPPDAAQQVQGAGLFRTMLRKMSNIAKNLSMEGEGEED